MLQNDTMFPLIMGSAGGFARGGDQASPWGRGDARPAQGWTAGPRGRLDGYEQRVLRGR